MQDGGGCHLKKIKNHDILKTVGTVPAEFGVLMPILPCLL